MQFRDIPEQVFLGCIRSQTWGWRGGYKLIALSGLPEEPGTVPSMYMVAHNSVTTLPVYTIHLWPSQSPPQTCIHTNTQAHMNTYKINLINKLLFCLIIKKAVWASHGKQTSKPQSAMVSA